MIFSFCLALLTQWLSSINVPKPSLLKADVKHVYKKEILIVNSSMLKSLIRLLEYILILIVITGNAGYLISIVSGHFLGLLMFQIS